MIDITSFLLKHLYELMADNYNATTQRDNELALRRQQLPRAASRQQPAERPCSSHSLGQLDESAGLDEEEAGQLACDTDCRLLDCCHPQRVESERSHSSNQARMDATNNQTATRDNNNNSSQRQGQPTGPLALLKRNFSSACQTESSRSSRLVAREQETNQQIVSFLINNQLPDLACETLIELIFISVFLAISWIFVMIVQLHCQQSAANGTGLPTASSNVMDQLVDQSQRQHSYESARHFYCNTKFLNSLMYCNNRDSRLYSS